MTQEAQLKDNIQLTSDRHAVLYFPDFRPTIHSIVTGDQDVIQKYTPIITDLSPIRKSYLDAIEDCDKDERITVSLRFVKEGIEFVVIYMKNKEMNECSYMLLTWEDDMQLITQLANAINELVIQTMRIIPNLIQDQKQFRNVINIDQNPLYDYIIFVYALFQKMGSTNLLLKPYVQLIMSTRKITYNMLVCMIKYVTPIPKTVEYHYNSSELIYEKQEYVKSDDGEFKATDNYFMCFKVLTYSGQVLNHRLNINCNTKREPRSNDRFIVIESTSGV